MADDKNGINKRAIVQRMEVSPKYSNAQKFAWAETIVVIIIIALFIAFVLGLNAVLPPGW